MNADEALDMAQTWQALPDANGAAHALAAEVVRLRGRVVDLEAELREMDESRRSALDLWRMSVHGVTSTNDLPGGAWSSS